MSEENKENKSTPIEKTQEVDIQKSTRIEKAQNQSDSIKEGYQPTDTLDTSNPPKGNDSSSDSKSKE